MSPKTFKYLFIVNFILRLTTCEMQIQECAYEPDNDINVVSNEGYPACFIKGDSILDDQAIDQNLTKLITIMVFPHDFAKVIWTRNPVYYDCGNCIWCREYLIECSEKSDYGQIDGVCNSLILEPSTESCIIHTDKNLQFITDEKYNRTSIDALGPYYSNSFTKSVHIPIGGTEKNDVARQRRFAKACSFPNAMETAAINCRIYPESVKCVQRCAFGYTLDRGIKQELQCILKENVWRPTGFRECQPFVDCTVTLKSPGHTNCTTMSLNKPPKCEVYCAEYEDKSDVPEEVYTCDIGGKWEPPLPFCAIPGGGLLLTRAPQKKLHD